MRFYLDASVLVALIDDEPTRPLFDSLLTQSGATFLVSDFAMAETSAALMTLWRRRQQSALLTKAELNRLDAWARDFTERVAISSPDIEEAKTHVRHLEVILRAPDAIHIATADRLGATLLTLDRGMARAAAALDVAYLNPADATADRKT